AQLVDRHARRKGRSRHHHHISVVLDGLAATIVGAHIRQLEKVRRHKSAHDASFQSLGGDLEIVTSAREVHWSGLPKEARTLGDADDTSNCHVVISSRRRRRLRGHFLALLISTGSVFFFAIFDGLALLTQITGAVVFFAIFDGLALLTQITGAVVF